MTHPPAKNRLRLDGIRYAVPPNAFGVLWCPRIIGINSYCVPRLSSATAYGLQAFGIVVHNYFLEFASRSLRIRYGVPRIPAIDISIIIVSYHYSFVSPRNHAESVRNCK